MKILQVTGFPNNGAGSGTLITTQAEGLVKDGNEVCCILSENSSNFPGASIEWADTHTHTHTHTHTQQRHEFRG